MNQRVATAEFSRGRYARWWLSKRYTRIEGRKLGRGRTRDRFIGRDSLQVLRGGDGNGDETSGAKPRAYINRQQEIRIHRAVLLALQGTTLCLNLTGIRYTPRYYPLIVR